MVFSVNHEEICGINQLFLLPFPVLPVVSQCCGWDINPWMAPPGGQFVPVELLFQVSSFLFVTYSTYLYIVRGNVIGFPLPVLCFT